MNKDLPKPNVYEGYDPSKPLIPHGISVCITAPAVFKFTAASNPERHIQAAEALGADVSNAKYNGEYAGALLADCILGYMDALNVPLGLSSFGYGREHIPDLVKGTLPQQRVLKISPHSVEADDLADLFENSLKY